MFHDIKSYGRDFLKVVRNCEATAKKLARFRNNHLRLTLRCKQNDVTPTSLRIRCPINSAIAKSITKIAERGLVYERIRLINGRLSSLRSDYDNDVDIISRTLPTELANKVFDHVNVLQEKVFLKTKERHQDKFGRFLLKKDIQEKSARQDISDEQRQRWVINLSHSELSATQINVLAKGLNFAVTPATLPKEDFVVATEKACSQLNAAEAEELYFFTQ